ncbi:MAG: beta-eliminating lyase-related protein [Hyphomonadaceae bacterium]|nr:beta-eliminating lyase-related protein [Hyphomonadaceae bacterium]
MSLSVYSEKTLSLVRAETERVLSQDPLASIFEIERWVQEQDEWRSRHCLNLNPAESLLSRRCRRILDSDLATRLSEGHPGDKIYPPKRQHRYIDRIEAQILGLTRELFGATYVEWRPSSTSLANAAVFFAGLRPGDVALVQGDNNGGNYAYNSRGPIALTGARIEPIAPQGDCFEFDLDEFRRQVDRLQPKMIVIGGSYVLFPYPVSEMRRIADRCGARLVYDGAHLGLLLSKGDFQRPLEEGAHALIVSTHKVMGGPVGGLVLSNDAEFMSRILDITFPGLLQTRDLNKYASLALALNEIRAFGTPLAKAMVHNAKALAQSLEADGFRVLGRVRSFTQSHQIFVHLGNRAADAEQRCQDAGILLARSLMVGDERDNPSGSRLATHEVTRQGMGESEMALISSFIRRVVMDGERPEQVAEDVSRLLTRFPDIQYSFDAAKEPNLNQ